MRSRIAAAALLSAALAGCGGAGRERAYLGNLHAHTRLSDGVAEPAPAFARARSIRLSFLALTDHGEDLGPQEWRELKAAARAASAPGRFAALAGWEWSSPTEGHFLVLGTGEAGSSCSAPRSLEELARWTRRWGGLLIYAHPGAFEEFGSVLASALEGHDVAGQEVGSLYSGPPGSGYAYHDYEDAYREALRRGLKVGALINQDNHHEQVGDARRGGLTGVWMRRLGAAELLQALRARRCYGTEAAGVSVDFEINRVRMGGTLRTKSPLEVQAFLQGLHAGIVFVRAELWAARAGQPVWTWLRYDRGRPLVARLPPPARPEVYYFRAEMRAMYGVVARAFSSPLWVERGADPILRGLAVEPSWPALERPAIARVRIENAGPEPSTGGELRLTGEGGFSWNQPVPVLSPRGGLTVRLPLVTMLEHETLQAELMVPGASGPQLRGLWSVDSCAADSGPATIELRDLDGRLVQSAQIQVSGCMPADQALRGLFPLDLCGGLLRRVGPLSADAQTHLEVLVDGSRAEVGLAKLPLRAGHTLTIRPRPR